MSFFQGLPCCRGWVIAEVQARRMSGDNVRSMQQSMICSVSQHHQVVSNHIRSMRSKTTLTAYGASSRGAIWWPVPGGKYVVRRPVVPRSQVFDWRRLA